MKQRLYLIAAVIILVGLSSATVIYLIAEDDSSSSLISEFEGSKRFKHDLELYGGKWNVVANELINWFAGLWQGKTLALTITVITIFISFALFYVARHLPSDLKPNERDERNQNADFIL